jgi:hypothetical protein
MIHNIHKTLHGHAFRAPPCGVISSTGKPVSAKQNLSSPRSRAGTILCPLLGFFLFLFPSQLRADALEDAAHDLAMKVCGVPHKQSVQVRWQESPETSGYLSDSRKKVFLEQISACGIAPAENSTAPVLLVAVQVTPARILLVADFTETPNGRQVRMVEIPRALLSSSTAAPSGPHLKSELLWQQQEPIESAIEWQGPSQERFLFLLNDAQLIRMRFENGAWKVLDSTELPRTRTRSRAPHETFAYAYTGKPFEILLDGKACDFPPSGPVSFACAPLNPTPSSLRISSQCEDLPRFLATGNGDYTQPDRIILRGPALDPAPIPSNQGDADSLELPGPVLGISLAENAKAAFPVIRNLATGNYEVYRITAVCSD